MGNITEKIKTQIGEGELPEAIETLVSFLKTVGGDLYNQSIHLRGKYKTYERERNLMLADRQEVRAQISMSVLSLADQIEQRNLENPPSQKDFDKMKPDPAQVQQMQRQSHFKQEFQAPPKQPQQPQYLAQCFFQGDLMQYFIQQDNQILAINPMNNQALIVGMKLPSQDFRFAWTIYVTATNIYYLVDHAGLIWGQNFGMPLQVGYVKYF